MLILTMNECLFQKKTDLEVDDRVQGKTALGGYIPVLSFEHQAAAPVKQREASPAIYVLSIMHFL